MKDVDGSSKINLLLPVNESINPAIKVGFFPTFVSFSVVNYTLQVTKSLVCLSSISVFLSVVKRIPINQHQ